MKTKLFVLTACALALVSGCASRASGVAPISISAAEYSHLSCEEARASLEVARQQEIALTRRQNNAATTDAAMVFLFALPLGSVFGGDVAGELARAKGEVLALERAVPQRCAAEAAAAQSAAAQAAAPAATTPVSTEAPVQAVQ